MSSEGGKKEDYEYDGRAEVYEDKYFLGVLV